MLHQIKLTYGRRLLRLHHHPASGGWGSGGRDHSFGRLLRPTAISVRPPGSGRTDQVLADGARSSPARGQDRRGVDHVALDPFGLQHPVDPEAVQTGLLDDDNREVPAGPRRSLAPEVREPTQQPRHVARRNRVLGHLLPAPAGLSLTPGVHPVPTRRVSGLTGSTPLPQWLKGITKDRGAVTRRRRRSGAAKS